MRNLILCSIIVVLAACSYLPEDFNRNTGVTQSEDPDWIILKPTTASLRETGIIYIPGGFVDPHAYIPALDDMVAIEGHVVLIPKVSANLAILNVKKALEGPELADEVQNWLIGGHSLGGATACLLVEQSPEVFAGLFLTGAYSSVDLSTLDRPVLSLLGEFDGVLRQEAFTESLSNLPPQNWLDELSDMPTNSTLGETIYYEIPGGNHAGFGGYGAQRGDNEATITPAAQQKVVNRFITAFLQANGLGN